MTEAGVEKTRRGDTLQQDDEQKIRDLIAAWQRLTAADDLPQLLRLMAEDGVFLVPGHPPMGGRDAFAAGFQKAISSFELSQALRSRRFKLQEIGRTVGLI